MAAGGHAVKCYLESHLAHKDGGEDVVGDGEEDSFLETQSERGEDERSNEIRQIGSAERSRRDAFTKLPCRILGLSRATVMQLEKMKASTT